MRLLTAGIDSTVIALWLGHESIETTQGYLHVDNRTKEDALARTTPTETGRGYRPEDDTLLVVLRTLNSSEPATTVTASAIEVTHYIGITTTLANANQNIRLEPIG